MVSADLVPTEVATPLICHPASLDSGVSGIAVTVSRRADGGLALNYRLQGDLAGIRIPTDADHLPPDRLWAYTCFEVFLARADAPDYREFNFSPNGQWARFEFRDYRQRIEPANDSALPQIQVSSGADALTLDAELPADALVGAGLLGLTAVIQRADGAHSYWALRHPAAQPDFHHRGGFVLPVPAIP